MSAKRVESVAVSVIIPTYNRWATLRTCLEALAVQTIGAERLEVVVVDDGSPADESAALAAVAWPFALTTLRQDNQGPAAARNRGLEVVSAPLTLFINDDTILAPEAVERHLAIQRVTPCPIMLLGRFDFLPGYAATPLGRMLSTGSHLFQYEMLRSGDFADYHFAYTCNLSVPTGAAQAARFDADFTGPAGEDIDFGFRLQGDGFGLLYDSGIGSYHDHVLTVGSLPRTFATRGQGSVTFALKHGSRDGARLGATRAALAAAAREQDHMDETIDEATASLADRLDRVGPGEPIPHEAWDDLTRLAGAASMRGALTTRTGGASPPEAPTR